MKQTTDPFQCTVQGHPARSQCRAATSLVLRHLPAQENTLHLQKDPSPFPSARLLLCFLSLWA